MSEMPNNDMSEMESYRTFRDTPRQNRGNSTSRREAEEMYGNEELKASNGTYSGLWAQEESIGSDKESNEQGQYERENDRDYDESEGKASENVSESICGTEIERDVIKSLKIVTGDKREIEDDVSVSK